jgi:3,4-dihydroxy 2-butanone 4-phosphate synthase/GTP cyclohydrolase II
MKFDTIPSAIEDIKKGKIVICVDDEDRENEGDFICAAEKVTPEIINFMSQFGRGLICVSALPKRLEELELDLMVKDNTALHGTPFTVSIDAKKGTTTGISAHDRTTTILQFISKSAKPSDFARPGHIFPLRAKEGGVLKRAGHTEASVDLARLAGLYPAGVLCEIMDDDGRMAKLPKLMKLKEKFDLKLITVEALIKYRMKREKLVEKVAVTKLPTSYGEFKLLLYKNILNNKHHIALIKGEIDPTKPILVRVHSQCLTGDVFNSLRCDCGEQLQKALEMIQKEKYGVLLYMTDEGRGIGLANKIKAYELQDKGLDTVEANERLGFLPDLREYGIGAQILVDIGVRKIKLLTNNPKKIVGLEGFNLKVVERVKIQAKVTSVNKKYLLTKKKKLGHLLELSEE